MRMRSNKAAVIVISAAAVLLVGQLTGVRDYLQDMRNRHLEDSNSVPAIAASVAEQPLLEQIQAEAKTRSKPAVDARMDPIWKAIPGYNGLEVDVEATYRQALAAPGTPIKYIYKEVAPKVQLEQLGQHPTYRGNPNKPMVAFMINVAWGNEFIVPMLDTLDAEGVKATFFLDGSWLKKNPELAKTIQKRGHELSNHAYSHPAMSRVSRERARLEITKTEQLLKDTLGVKNVWFAPPSGDFDQETIEVAAEAGLRTVLWTLDTVDWKKPEPGAVVNKITKRVEPGALILMHPTSSSSQALKGMIQGIRSKGLTLGTVSETLSSRRVPSTQVE
nr:polysaccharide deacetylase family protein [Paenibacillus massiliensis]